MIIIGINSLNELNKAEFNPRDKNYKGNSITLLLLRVIIIPCPEWPFRFALDLHLHVPLILFVDACFC